MRCCTLVWPVLVLFVSEGCSLQGRPAGQNASVSAQSARDNGAVGAVVQAPPGPDHVQGKAPSDSRQLSPQELAQSSVSPDVDKKRGKVKVKPSAFFYVPHKHASLHLSLSGTTIVVDPTMEGLEALQGNLPLEPDLILITDIHPDHLDPAAILKLKGKSTRLMAPLAASEALGDYEGLKYGDEIEVKSVHIKTVPAYNLKRKNPDNGEFWHPNGRGNGYVLSGAGKKIYISGDTECVPEIKTLKGIDFAFICMNLPYTMPVEEAAQCVGAMKPKVVVPYHYRGQDVTKFQQLVKERGTISVEMRDWYPG